MISLNITTAQIPFQKELQTLSLLTPAQKKELTIAWTTLHQMYETQNSTTPATTLTALQAKSIAPLFSTNYFTLFAKYLSNPQNFLTIKSPEQKNYATMHLVKTMERLASVSQLSFTNNEPKISFSGDNRDFGVIVNIKNNTDSRFSIYQSSLDGKIKTQIGQVVAGINAVNLHTAALQNPQTKNAKTKQPSAYYFDFYELNAENPTYISIRMYTGQELIDFLETLPRKDKSSFQLNGLPTGKEYLTHLQDWYMVLIQNPTEKTQPEPNIDQRIQAINISKLSGPYLLKMQINQSSVAITAQSSTTDETLELFQPSLTNALIPKNQYAQLTQCPFIILPSFLWTMPQIKTLWILNYTTYIAALTQYKIVGVNSFGKAFTYFEQLGFFNITNEHSLFVDLYNRFKPGYNLYNASWLMSAGLYETSLNICTDIPQIYTAQNSFGEVIANGHNFYDFTFLTIFEPQDSQTASEKLLENKDFNAIYSLPKYQLYSSITNARQTDLKKGIFGSLTKIKSNVYKLTYSNKKNKILSSQYLYLDSPVSNIQIIFVNFEQEPNWTGTALPTNLIPQKPGETTHFKVTYEYSATNNKHILLTQSTSAIDKQEAILPLYFSKYPIQELYVDVFHKFNVAPYTRCFIIQDGIIPDPLTSLLEQDWKNGIYMIPTIENNDQITPNNPGALTLVFYKYDKTMIGKLTINGQYNNTAEKGIKEPVTAYNPHFTETNCISDLYLTTGVLLRYNS